MHSEGRRQLGAGGMRGLGAAGWLRVALGSVTLVSIAFMAGGALEVAILAPQWWAAFCAAVALLAAAMAWCASVIIRGTP